MKLKACLLVVSLTLKRSTLALKNRILRITGKYPNKGCDDLWGWFGLSRASWLTMPRVLMHEMPDVWQEKMAKLLEEYENTFDLSNYNIDIEVRGKKDGKYVQIPSELCDYRHPCRKDIERLKVK